MVGERDRIFADDATLGTLYTYDGGVLTSSVPYLASGYLDKMSDVVHADFHRRRNSGEVIMSPMYHVKSNFSQTVGGYSCLKGGCSNPSAVPRECDQVMYPGLTEAPDWLVWGNDELQSMINQVRDVALTEAFANVEPPTFELLVSLAEAKKTLKLLTSTASEIGHRARRGYLKDRVDFFDKWLEGRYGWRPLFYDMMGMVDYFNRQIQKPKRKRALASDLDSDSLEQVDVSGTDWTVVRTYNADFTVSAKAGVLYDWSGDRGADIQNALGLNRPASVAWELVPYSFVVDWFTNIGDYIAAWSPKGGVNQLGAWCTVKVDANFSGSYHIVEDTDPDVGWCLLDGYESVVNQEFSILQRSIHSTPPILPTVDFNGLNPQQILDVIALMRNILKGAPRRHRI